MGIHPGFLPSIIVILLAARLAGEAAQRLGQPAVIGQLVAGILLGPSFFGLFWPAAQRALFSPAPAQEAMVQGVAEFGILLLLLLTGMDIDRRLLRKIGWPAVSVSIFGTVAPFALGVVLGYLAPGSLIPNAHRLPTALFLGVALSISSIKIVAVVVREMDFARRDLGQIIIASSILEDSLGWIVIAVILGIVGAGRFEPAHFARTVAGVAIFLALSVTIGRRLVAHAIRLVNDSFVGEYMVLTLVLLLMGAMALATQALGVQTVLGAFVAGVLVGESPILTKRIADQLRGMVAALFAPVFFALAGLRTDLAVLNSPEVIVLTLGLVVFASLGKFLGAFAGGRAGRLSRSESLALAIGMNARGSTELIVASIGLSSGALTQTLYSMIVAMAALTTCAMPPTLRWALKRVPMRPGERERIEKEAFEANGFVANMKRFLVLASDHPNGRLASRLVGLLAGARGRPATVLHVSSRTAPSHAPRPETAAMASDLKQGVDHARQARPEEADDTPNVAVKARQEAAPLDGALSAEAPKGYDFLVIGLDPAYMPGGGFNPEIAESARAFDGPVSVVVARGAHERDPVFAALRILAPVTGTVSTRRSAEVAIELARAASAPLTVLFVSPEIVESSVNAKRRKILYNRNEEATFQEIAEIADRREQPVQLRSRSSRNLPDAILEEAGRQGATLIVLGTTSRPSEALLFGDAANRLLEESRRSLLFVAS
jgi:Kef-type K+ transport system membrane component KefB/nucleotide-binding universal stress UspA family protein